MRHVAKRDFEEALTATLCTVADDTEKPEGSDGQEGVETPTEAGRGP